MRSLQWQISTYAQTSAAPCHDNTVTVVLEANVPLYARGECTSAFTLSGLYPTASCNEPDYPVVLMGAGSSTSDATTEVGNSSWSAGGGELTIVPTLLEAGQSYAFKFTLINPTSPQNKSIDVGKGEAPTSGALTTLTGERFIVEEAKITITEFVQQSRHPCDDSTITVKLHSSHDLLETCDPKVTLSGFRNTGATKAIPSQWR